MSAPPPEETALGGTRREAAAALLLVDARHIGTCYLSTRYLQLLKKQTVSRL